MRSSKATYSIIVEIICLIYVLLFVYAAISKMIDFDHFRLQLGKSPLLTAYAGWVAWAVPIIELFIALFLLFRKTRFIGLVGAFTLMAMFTLYIYIILHYSSFIPCSCGGVLQNMGWTDHIIFNSVFLVLALIGILLIEKQFKNKSKQNTT